MGQVFSFAVLRWLCTAPLSLGFATVWSTARNSLSVFHSDVIVLVIFIFFNLVFPVFVPVVLSVSPLPRLVFVYSVLIFIAHDPLL